MRHIGMNTHTSAQPLLPLEEPPPDGRTFLNASVWFVDSDGYRVVFRWHEPLYRVALTDEVHLRLVAVALRQSRLATQEEICRAFGHGVSTQARWERQYRKHGIDGLVSKKPSGRRRELDKSQEAFVRRWFHAGWSNRQMAKRLGVDEATIRRTLKRLGLARKPAAIPRMLPEIEEQAAERPPGGGDCSTPAAAAERRRRRRRKRFARRRPLAASSERARPDGAVPLERVAPRRSFTLDHDPRDRSGDRALARLGLLDDAVPLFADHGMPAACRGVVGRAAVGPPRADRGVRQGVRFPAPVVLRSADDRGDAVSRGVVADQAARAFQRIPSAGSGSDPGAGPGAGSQDGAAQVHATGGDGTRASC